MATDLPEDLCRRLNDLEATVRGLTNELVDTNERLRALETTLTEPTPDTDEPTPDHPEESAENNPDIEDDIIIA